VVTQSGMSGIQALAAAAAATSKINTPGATTVVSGQPIKIIQHPGGTIVNQQDLRGNALQTTLASGQPIRIATASPGSQSNVIKAATLGKSQIILQKPGGAGQVQIAHFLFSHCFLSVVIASKIKLCLFHRLSLW